MDPYRQKPRQPGFLFSSSVVMYGRSARLFSSPFKDKITPILNVFHKVCSCLLTVHGAQEDLPYDLNLKYHRLLKLSFDLIPPYISRIHREPLQPWLLYLNFWYSQDSYVLSRSWTTYSSGGIWERGMIYLKENVFMKLITRYRECIPIKEDGLVPVTSVHHWKHTSKTDSNSHLCFLCFCFVLTLPSEFKKNYFYLYIKVKMHWNISLPEKVGNYCLLNTWYWEADWLNLELPRKQGSGHAYGRLTWLC